MPSESMAAAMFAIALMVILLPLLAWLSDELDLFMARFEPTERVGPDGRIVTMGRRVRSKHKRNTMH